MKTPHTGAWEGKRIKVTLKDGTTFVDKFAGSKGKWRFFEQFGKVEAGSIKRFIIWKGLSTPIKR
jgi:hypothetical protein